MVREPQTGRGRSSREIDSDEEFLNQTGDLRYEGPESFEGEEYEDGEEDEYDDEPGRGGSRVFLTATLIGALVIVLVGVALWLRRDSSGDSGIEQARSNPSTVPAAPVQEFNRPVLPPEGVPPASADAQGSGNPDSPFRQIPENPPSPSAINGAMISESTPSSPAPSALPPSPADTAPEPKAVHAATTTPKASIKENLPPAPAPASERLAQEPEPKPTAATAKKAKSAAKPEPTPASQVIQPKTTVEDTASEHAQEDRASAPSGKTKIHTLVAQSKLTAATKASLAQLRKSPKSAYSLQVVFACKVETVKDDFRRVPDDVLYLLSATQKKGCYRILWGVFPSKAEAQAAAETAPAFFRRTEKPRPVPLDKIIKP